MSCASRNLQGLNGWLKRPARAPAVKHGAHDGGGQLDRRSAVDEHKGPVCLAARILAPSPHPALQKSRKHRAPLGSLPRRCKLQRPGAATAPCVPVALPRQALRPTSASPAQFPPLMSHAIRLPGREGRRRSRLPPQCAGGTAAKRRSAAELLYALLSQERVGHQVRVACIGHCRSTTQEVGSPSMAAS